MDAPQQEINSINLDIRDKFNYFISSKLLWLMNIDIPNP